MSEKATIRLATSPRSWGVLSKDGGPSDVHWTRFLDEAAMAGYGMLELGPYDYLPTDRDILSKALDSRNMRICAGTLCVAFEEIRNFNYLGDELDEVCDILYDMGADRLVLMDVPSKGAERQVGRKDMRRVFRIIREIEEYAREVYELETVFHPRAGSLIETEQEIDLLLDVCQDVNLCLDTGHHAYVNSSYADRDDSVAEFIRWHSDRIPYLHLRNIDSDILKQARDMGLSYEDAVAMGMMCPLDRGMIDFREIRDVLVEAAFNGIAVIETDIPQAHPGDAFDAARHNLDYLRFLGL